MILLTGVTGKTASVAAKELAAKKVPMRAIVRNADKAQAIKDLGIEVVIGDVGDAAVLKTAMSGVESALLLLPNGEKQEAMEKGFIDAAKAAGVKRVVKVSSIEASPDAHATIPRIHGAVEAHLKGSGLAWTMVRPGFYMANLLGSARTIKANGTIVMPCGNGKLGMIDSRDVGSVIAKVMSTPGHEGKSYGLSGPQSLGMSDVAQEFSTVLGKPIVYIDQPKEEYGAMLAKFLPKWHAEAVTELIAGIADNTLDMVTPTVKELTGRDPIPLRQFIKDNIAVFQ